MTEYANSMVFGEKLCKAFNIPIDGVTKITIEVSAGEIARVSIHRLVSPDEGDAVYEAIQNFALVHPPTDAEESNGKL